MNGTYFSNICFGCESTLVIIKAKQPKSGDLYDVITQ